MRKAEHLFRLCCIQTLENFKVNQRQNIARENMILYAIAHLQLLEIERIIKYIFSYDYCVMILQQETGI